MDLNISTKLGKRLKMIRVASGMKQKSLSNALNIPASLLSMYENGKRKLPLNFLEKFSTFFHIPISQLFIMMEDEPSETRNDEATSLLNDMKSRIFSLERKYLKNLYEIK